MLYLSSSLFIGMFFFSDSRAFYSMLAMVDYFRVPLGYAILTSRNTLS